jgi:phosphonopyruvate decarboxylase
MPDRHIVLLDGDGSLLMNLGALVTIADAAPKNLVHFLCRNGTYEANGSHPIPGRGRVDFAGMARAAGYPRCYRFADLATFETGIGSLLQEEGPVFADLELEPGEKYPRDYGVMHGAQIRRDFAAALKGGAA